MREKNVLGWILLSTILITPRIQIIQIAGSYIRFEDLLFCLNIFWVLHNRASFDGFPTKVLKLYRVLGVLMCVGVLSSLFAAADNRNSLISGILYSIRPIEYATLIPTIYLILRSRIEPINRLLKIFTITTFISSLLQTYFSFRIGTNRFGFSRSSALTGGPYELAMISVLLLIYWISHKYFIFALLCFVSLIASASRISILALGIAAIVLAFLAPANQYFRFQRRKRSSFTLFRSILITSLILVLLNETMALSNVSQVFLRYQNRVQTTESNFSTLKDSYELAKGLPAIKSSEQYSNYIFLEAPDFTGGLESSDASTRRRYFVWFALIKTFLESGSYIWGLGPGFAGSAVDGNYVRIIAECGILGVIVYWRWFIALLRNSTYWLKASIVSVLITGIYIDIFTSIKTVLLIYIFFILSFLEQDSFLLSTRNPQF